MNTPTNNKNRVRLVVIKLYDWIITKIHGNVPIFIFLSVLSIMFIYFNQSAENERSHKVTIYAIVLVIFVIMAIIIGLIIKENDIRDFSITDEKVIENKKEEFLKDILAHLSIIVDDNLKNLLQLGEIDEANDFIDEKISALNKLINTVKGDNTNSLRGTDISSVTEFYESTSNRIRTEIKRNTTSSNVNLWVGVMATSAAVGLLIRGIEGHKIELIELIPRVTLSLLIQGFAFFFFSQYRKQQEEIKYWNNEKTKLDLKIFAISIAIDDAKIGTKEFMQRLVIDMVTAERNILGPTPDKETKEEKAKDKIDDTALLKEVAAKLKDLTSLLPSK